MLILLHGTVPYILFFHLIEVSGLVLHQDPDPHQIDRSDSEKYLHQNDLDPQHIPLGVLPAFSPFHPPINITTPTGLCKGLPPVYESYVGRYFVYESEIRLATHLSMNTTPTSQAASPKGPMYIRDFLATGAALGQERAFMTYFSLRYRTYVQVGTYGSNCTGTITVW